ncbi:MAG: hypothetical protein QM500_15645 [Methylococcales bacterium]
MCDLLVLPNVTDSYVHGSNKCREIKIFLNLNKSFFEYSLIPDLSNINYRAECHTGIDIEHISYLCKNEYQIDYAYDWNVYNGCEDMEETGTEHESVIFSISDIGDIYFETEHMENRSSHDEL